LSPKLLSEIRAQFPGAVRSIYLDTSAHGLMPSGAREAVGRYIEDCINEGGTKATMRDTLDRVRTKFARLIGASPDEIAIVKNVSEGINAILTALSWQAGDNAVLCTELEHPNAIYALYNMRDRAGIEVKSVAPTPELTVSTDAIANAIDGRTRIVIVSTVAYATGGRTDIEALARVCARRNVLLLVDGAQSIGVLHFDVTRTPVDALVVGASKFLCGPSGFGFLYVRRDRAQSLRPGSLARYGVDMGDAHESQHGGAAYRLMPGARRFEGGSFNYAGANATEAALDLIGDVTVTVIEQHVLALASRLRSGLAELRLPLIGGAAPERPSQIVVVAPGAGGETMPLPLSDLHRSLTSKGVKLSMRHGRLRLAFHLYNAAEDVTKTLSLVSDHLLYNGGQPS
jgi:selenocysteine lyase/cysteine desulfurase